MKIEATNKALIVRFKSHAKQYASAAGEQDLAGPAAPFDEVAVAVGQSVTLEDCDIVGIAEL